VCDADDGYCECCVLRFMRFVSIAMYVGTSLNRNWCAAATYRGLCATQRTAAVSVAFYAFFLFLFPSQCMLVRG
jgi:hypothetical protein